MRDTLAAAASMRTLGEALRAQTPEHGNRMHTAVAILELGRTEGAVSLLTASARQSQMLVDDEALTLELHRGYIDRIEGFEVVAECSGARAAVAAVLEDAPGDGVDLILLDMTMPDGSGLDVLRHLRAHGAEVDVIAIPSVRDADVVRQAISLGATHYLVKPFTFAALHERLEQYRLFHRREAGHVASRRATVSRAPGRGRPHRAGCAVRRSGQTGVGVPLAPLRDCARQEPVPPPSRSAKDRPSPR